LHKKKSIKAGVWTVLISLCVLSGCGPRAISTTARVHFEAASEAEMMQAAQILQARFNELRPSYFSTVTTTVVAQDVALEFRGEAPADETIGSYAASQGIFRLYPLDAQNNLLVTDLDIEQVSATQGSTGPMLDLRVSESAGKRLLAYTSRNLGRVLITSWDRKEQSRAVVGGVFARQFQTTGMDRDTAMRLTIILRSGRLPVAVRSVDIAH
jgi:preprotein translocase subunit SecD